MTYQQIRINVLLLYFLLTPFINKPDSSRDLTIFMVSFKSSFENTRSKYFLLNNLYVAEAVIINHKGTRHF